MSKLKNNIKFLIVNDDRLVCLVTRQVIRNYCSGCSFTIKSEGKSALKYLFTTLADNKAKDPDVIFIDLSMPIMDGAAFLECFSKCGKNLRHISVYILTSTIDADVEKMADLYPFLKGILELPLTLEKLIAIFHSITNNLKGNLIVM